MTPVKHVAWDQGAIADSFQEVLGVVLPQHTTKTLCGKRVPMSAIDNQGKHTCIGCTAQLAYQTQGHKTIKAYELILNAERALRRPLSNGECSDLILDNMDDVNGTAESHVIVNAIRPGAFTK